MAAGVPGIPSGFLLPAEVLSGRPFCGVRTSVPSTPLSGRGSCLRTSPSLSSAFSGGQSRCPPFHPQEIWDMCRQSGNLSFLLLHHLRW